MMERKLPHMQPRSCQTFRNVELLSCFWKRVPRWLPQKMASEGESLSPRGDRQVGLIFAKAGGHCATVEYGVGRACGEKLDMNDPVWGPGAIYLRRKEAGLSGAPIPTLRAVFCKAVAFPALAWAAPLGYVWPPQGLLCMGTWGMSSREAHSSLAP